MNKKDIEIKESEIQNNEIIEQNEDLKQAKQDQGNNLLTDHARYVESIAKLYENQGLSLDELISAGNKGLIAAAEHFQPNAKFRFVAYAVWWIRHYILLAIEEKKKQTTK